MRRQEESTEKTEITEQTEILKVFPVFFWRRLQPSFVNAGKADWAAVLKAAKKAGVKYYFIEDEAETASQQIPPSLRYLEGLRF